MGNKYYTNSKNSSSINAKRWVIYNGEIEASKIPPHWHAWLHKTVNEPPLNYKPRYDWQKEHESNKTGTEESHKPDGSLTLDLKKNKKKYETWKS